MSRGSAAALAFGATVMLTGCSNGEPAAAPTAVPTAEQIAAARGFCARLQKSGAAGLSADEIGWSTMPLAAQRRVPELCPAEYRDWINRGLPLDDSNVTDDSPAAAPESQEERLAAFLQAMRSEDLGGASYTDADLIDLGQATCWWMREHGGNADHVNSLYEQMGYPNAPIEVLVRVAPQVYCA